MNRSALLALVLLTGCENQSALDVFEGRALREIDRCLAHGRDCGLRGSDYPNHAERARLRAVCRDVGRVSPPENAGGYYRLTLTCRVDDMTVAYTATADLGLPKELREPVVSYEIRR